MMLILFLINKLAVNPLTLKDNLLFLLTSTAFISMMIGIVFASVHAENRLFLKYLKEHDI